LISEAGTFLLLLRAGCERVRGKREVEGRKERKTERGKRRGSKVSEVKRYVRSCWLRWRSWEQQCNLPVHKQGCTHTHTHTPTLSTSAGCQHTLIPGDRSLNNAVSLPSRSQTLQTHTHTHTIVYCINAH